MLLYNHNFKTWNKNPGRNKIRGEIKTQRPRYSSFKWEVTPATQIEDGCKKIEKLFLVFPLKVLLKKLRKFWHVQNASSVIVFHSDRELLLSLPKWRSWNCLLQVRHSFTVSTYFLDSSSELLYDLEQIRTQVHIWNVGFRKFYEQLSYP